jgi:hypothetical protein
MRISTVVLSQDLDGCGRRVEERAREERDKREREQIDTKHHLPAVRLEENQRERRRSQQQVGRVRATILERPDRP